MAQGPSDTILMAIRITLRIRESKVRNPDPPDPRRFVLSEHSFLVIILSKLRLESWLLRTLLVFYRRLGIIGPYTRCAIQPLCEIMTSSTKPEIHNVPQRRQRRTEPLP